MQQKPNDPCRCGSGKKFKKCCGSAQPGKTSATEPAHILHALITLGNQHQTAGRVGEATACFREASRIAPHSALAQYNLGNALRVDQQIDAAIVAYIRAISLNPRFAAALCNVGNLLMQRRQRDDLVNAARHLRSAIAVQPDFADAHFNLACLLLLRGDYAAGWREYEWRWKVASAGPLWCRLQELGSLWRGDELLSGRSLLLHAEQGLGDSLQFIRYAATLANRGARVTVACQPTLVRLFRDCDGVSESFSQDDDQIPKTDFVVPLLSLPARLGTTLDSLPSAAPYIRANPRFVRMWRERIGDSSVSRIGIVWAGNSLRHDVEASRVDQRRSLTFAQLAPLATVQGARFVSLQIGEAASQTADLPPGLDILDPTAEISDFADTAAIVDQLDLVISVDTSVAHLAAAMGKPVWLLSRFDNCWRWLQEREDSPWYPTLRIFRQPRAGDWGSVITRVASELSKFVVRPRESSCRTGC